MEKNTLRSDTTDLFAGIDEGNSSGTGHIINQLGIPRLNSETCTIISGVLLSLELYLKGIESVDYFFSKNHLLLYFKRRHTGMTCFEIRCLSHCRLT